MRSDVQPPTPVLPEYELTDGASTGLDLVRGISAQVVVVGHGIAFFGVARFLHEPNFPWMQNAAVLIFFLLSGFLIPYSVARRLARSSEYSMSHYLVDRFSRIFVPFVAALVFVLGIDSLSRWISPDRYKYTSAFDVKTFVGNLLMLQDHTAWTWFDDTRVTSFGSARPFWTLAIEWWIYLFFGFLVLVLFRKTLPLTSKLVIGIPLGIVPVFHAVDGRGTALTTYWVLGVLIFMLVIGRGAARIPRNVTVLLAVVACGLAVWRAYREMNSYDPVTAVLAALGLWLFVEWSSEFDFGAMGTRLVRIGASHAYTLYLIHYSVLDFIQVQGRVERDLNPWLLLVIAFVASNLIAYWIALWVEGPLTRQTKSRLYRFLSADTAAQSTAS